MKFDRSLFAEVPAKKPAAQFLEPLRIAAGCTRLPASRVQLLIEDLLACSRAGTGRKQPLDAFSEEALQQALMNLRDAVEEMRASKHRLQ